MTASLHPFLQEPLPKAWSIRTVNEVKSNEKHACVAGPFGSSISSKFFVQEGVPIIRGSNLTLGLERFISENFAFITPEKAASFSAQTVTADDLIFTCWGTIGQVGIIPKNGPYDRYIISNKQLKLRVNSDILDPIFAYYFFASQQSVDFLKSQAIGSAVPGINLGILKALPILLPPIQVQREIVNILSAYDDLIENNTRRIAILEDMARRLFEDWFVRAPNDELLEDWANATVADASAYVNRGIAPKYDDASATLVINQKCVRSQRLSLEPARRQSKSVPNDKMVRAGDILVNSTGVGTLGRVAQVFKAPEGTTVDTHVTIVRPGPDVDHHWFGLALLNLQSYFEDAGVGSTGQTELSRSRISEAELLIPDRGKMGRFGDLVGPMRLQTYSLEQANTNLRATRDLLLPKLISGEIEVRVAEEVLETAA
ncbi:MAG: restriction endonuclease subunit S [Pseudomonadota bacterium]